MSDNEAPREDSAQGSLGWLCPTESDRARLLDMSPRVRRARQIATGAVGVGMLLTVHDMKWTAIPLFAVCLLNLLTVDIRIKRSLRPERVVASSVVLIIVLIGASATLTVNEAYAVLPLLVLPVAMTAARFRPRVVWATAAFATLTAIVATTVDSPQRTVDHPLALASVVVLLVGVTAVTTALMDAEWQFRTESALDPLTGLLNRKGLETRFAEVGEQARLLEQPICLVMCDLDNFKRINDDYGHERGDAVLREISGELRRSLRNFELLYRLGGEEFLVLLPGVGLRQGEEIAEALRTTVERARPGGVTITASLGVSIAAGNAIDFLPLYTAADEALYRAKHRGRNVVEVSELPSGARLRSVPFRNPAVSAAG
jgi:diguanylate cyclase (GGDEF)-like protein